MLLFAYQIEAGEAEPCPTVQCFACDRWMCQCQHDAACNLHFDIDCSFEREED